MGGSEASAQPLPPPPSPLIRPLEGLPTWPVLGSCPELGATPEGCHQKQGTCHPGEPWACKWHPGIFPGRSGDAMPRATGPSRAAGLELDRRSGPAGLQCGWSQHCAEEGTGVACPLTPATGWHSSARNAKGSFVGGCLARPRTGHTGLILLQASWGRSAGGGPGLWSLLMPSCAPGIPQILLPRQLPAGPREC